MAWTAETIDRIYELYGQHIHQLHVEVTSVNRSLGSSKPEKTALKCLTRAEFETLLKGSTDDPEVTCLWVRRIIRGHEHEFPELVEENDSSHTLELNPLVGLPKQCRRKTGT
jgi:hypothetical protein